MKNNEQEPWLGYPKWQNGKIYSVEALTWKVFVGIAIFWNIVSLGASASLLLEGLPRFPDPAYLVLLFPASGLLLLVLAVKQYRLWRRYGPLPLTLDPYPGHVGGEVGGYLDLPARPADLIDLEATLSCVRVTVQRSSDNKSTRHERVIWQQRANTRVDAARNGARISFLIAVKADLPDAEPPSDHHYQWIIKLTAKQAQLVRSFNIPVFTTSQSEPSQLRLDATPQATSKSQFPAEVVQVQRRSDGMELVYPPSRNGNATPIVLAVIGLLFTGGGLFLANQAMTGTFSWLTALIALLILLSGFAMIAFSFYKKTNELRVLISHDTLYTRRSICFWKRVRSVPITRIIRLEKAITQHVGTGANATIYYSLQARTTAQEITIGDGITNQPLADGLLAMIDKEIHPTK